MCACTAQPPAVTRERRCHPGDRADKSEVRHDRPTPTDLNGSLPRRAAQGSPSPHAAGATPVNEEGPQETPKPSGPLAGRLLGGTGAGQRSAPPHGLPHPVAKVGPSFRAPGSVAKDRLAPCPLPAPAREELIPLLKNMEAICPISTRSVISKRFGDPRLSVEPTGRKGRRFVPVGTLEGAAELAGLSGRTHFPCLKLEKTFPNASCSKHLKTGSRRGPRGHW